MENTVRGIPLILPHKVQYALVKALPQVQYEKK